MESINDQYTQIENAISEIDGVVTRIDERLDIFIEKLNSLEKKIDNHIENCPVKCAFPDLIGRIKVIESKNGNALKQEIKEQLKEHADFSPPCRADVSSVSVSGIKSKSHHIDGQPKS